MGPFEYLEPQSIEEALSLLARYGAKAKVLAGGTDLVRREKWRKIVTLFEDRRPELYRL